LPSLKLSGIIGGFGTEWEFGSDLEESRRILDVYADRGGNFIDTANIYTNASSESYLGQILQNRRDRFVIATKYSLNADPTNPNAGGNHRKALVSAIEASLKRLNTDDIDLYWLHAWDYRNSMGHLNERSLALYQQITFDTIVNAWKV
jgi:aryl-alcohol dehydrogenase-like predicted oxidoreductase